jgi:inner membrane protein YidH
MHPRAADVTDQPPLAVPEASHATEFLANERTFLAWIRTSIAVIALGFAGTKVDLVLGGMLRKSGSSRWQEAVASVPVGVAMIGFGGLLAVLAALRFHVVNRQIERGRVRADRYLIALVTLLVVVLAVVLIVYFRLNAGANGL